MFFSAYLGVNEHLSRWRETLHRHAAWLDLNPYIFSRPVADGRVFAFGWVSLRPPDTDALVREDSDRLTIIPLNTPTRPEALAQDSRRAFETSAVRMDISLASGTVRISVPLLTVEQFYHAGDGRGWVFGNDLRLMIRWAGLHLDERAAYSFFQYDFIPPPLTISQTVQRIPGGFAFTLPSDGAPSLKRWFDAREIAEPRPEQASPVERVRAAIDGVLACVPQSPIVHFSGGVDSGLVAARLAALGRKDALLQNYTRGPDDPFHELAPQMAAHLGLPFEQVEWQLAEVPAILGDLTKEYTFPVSDPAVIPTIMLARAMDRWDFRPSALLTGTVAGNVLEMNMRYFTWRRVFMIPRPLRWLVAQAYPLGLWQSESETARAVAVMQRSAQLSSLQAATSAHGNLLGVAYNIPSEVHADIKQIVMETYEGVTEGADLSDRVVLMSMFRHGGSRCGARPFDAMRRRGVQTLHPFMEPAVLRAAFSLSWKERGDRKVSKVLLKRLLAESVPREWVYRARAGLPLPFSDVYTHPAVRAMVEDLVLSPQNPVMSLCLRRNVEQVFRRAEGRKPLNVGARRFVWALTSLSLWLSQLPSH